MRLCRKDIAAISKKLNEVNALNIPFPKDKGNFLANVLEDSLGNEREAYFQYLKQLKAETVNRFFLRYSEWNVGFSRTTCQSRTSSFGADWRRRSSWG